ncbi:hypothetical protein, partial [Deinococcus sp.]|uniref:hypothetical protein n=1 Tax=Deinococcus sp. TaxID=47478 RepID=UPI0028699C61
MREKAVPQRIVFKNKSGRTSHHVCFDCRKQFKKPVEVSAIRLSSGRVISKRFDITETVYPCPECGQPMLHVGKNFRSPVKEDVEGWEVARRLTGAGFMYAHVWVAYPTKLRDVPGFI